MRKSLQTLTPYKVKPEFDMIRLDNNEAFMSLLSSVDFSELEDTLINRYPAESSDRLVEAYARFAGFTTENVLAGNGSDEWISLICQFAIEPGDRVLVLEPDFSMYKKNAMIMGADIIQIPLNEDFSFPLDVVKEEIRNKKPKLVFLSNPNNPTGQLYSQEEIEAVIGALSETGGLLVLDEAYMDFAGESPFAGKVLDYENLIILRTASKALGMAALRLGFFIANDRLIEKISCIKPPYNVNTVSAQIGAQLMEKATVLDQFLLEQLEQIAELEEIMVGFAEQTEGAVLYPSSANFFLMKYDRAKELTDFLYERKIKIRCFDDETMKAIRVSAGTTEEHVQLREALNNWSERNA